MQTVNVELAKRGYVIQIAPGLLTKPSSYLPHISGHQVLIVSNDVVAPLYLKAVENAVSEKVCHTLVLADGEQTKTLQTANLIFDKLLSVPCDRQVTLIALGGGVIGDMVGFVAACYQRGVSFIQVPTTLLAQVDSSVGGKTAVNHPLGKNMIGIFHQPKAVIVDTMTLNTLDDRQFSAGLAEVIKYGLINNSIFFDWIEQNMTLILNRDVASLTHIIEQSCHNKAQIVVADERESGMRALLNLGHTFGHAIETGYGYGVWLHGEAVAMGLLMAADLSWRMGMIEAQTVERIKYILKIAKLPVSSLPTISPATMVNLMNRDKKKRQGQLPLVLLEGIGKAKTFTTYAQEKLIQTLEKYCQGS